MSDLNIKSDNEIDLDCKYTRQPSDYITIKWRKEIDLVRQYSRPFSKIIYSVLESIGEDSDYEGIDVSISTIIGDDGYRLATMIISITCYVDPHGLIMIDKTEHLKFFKNHINELIEAKVYILEALINNNGV